MSANTVGKSYTVPLKWSSAFQTSHMHEAVQRTFPALKHQVHRREPVPVLKKALFATWHGLTMT